jgi:membrane protein YdbS with pleckstrin-like domain
VKHQKFFRLEEGEKILKSIKPRPAFKWYLFFRSLSGFGLGLIFLSMIVLGGIFSSISKLGVSINIISVFINPLAVFITIFFIVLPFVIAHLIYKKQYYWITNKRVIYKNGLLGYRISSIPLERISDIILTRTFFENLFGFGSLHIQSLAGQFSGYARGSGRRLGSEGQLLAIPDPEGLQKLVFELIKKKRKSEKLTM